MASQIVKRKGSHVKIALEEKIESSSGAGFEDVRFIHDALPDLDLEKISCKAEAFGKTLEAPLFIAATTGGYDGAEKINKGLASAAQEAGIAFSLGSQRAMIENPSLAKTFKVRDVAPDILLFGNLGIAQLKEFPVDKIESAVSAVDADALAVHLNPLQEAIQKEGDKSFSGCLSALEKLCSRLSVPVIAKETGAGISAKTALKLEDAGVKMIDIAGLGGTSWALVEGNRSPAVPGFEDWGVPTAACVCQVSREVCIPVAGSGGVRSGVDSAKCIALGASLAGASLPFLKAWAGKRALETLEEWKRQLRISMFLSGSRDVQALRNASLLITGKTAELLLRMGIDPAEYTYR